MGILGLNDTTWPSKCQRIDASVWIIRSRTSKSPPSTAQVQQCFALNSSARKRELGLRNLLFSLFLKAMFSADIFLIQRRESIISAPWRTSKVLKDQMVSVRPFAGAICVNMCFMFFIVKIYCIWRRLAYSYCNICFSLFFIIFMLFICSLLWSRVLCVLCVSVLVWVAGWQALRQMLKGDENLL